MRKFRNLIARFFFWIGWAANDVGYKAVAPYGTPSSKETRWWSLQITAEANEDELDELTERVMTLLCEGHTVGKMHFCSRMVTMGTSWAEETFDEDTD